MIDHSEPLNAKEIGTKSKGVRRNRQDFLVESRSLLYEMALKAHVVGRRDRSDIKELGSKARSKKWQSVALSMLTICHVYIHCNLFCEYQH